MSTAAVAWALDARASGPMSAEQRLVLVALADYAQPTGRGAWPAVATLAQRLGITTRAVRRSLSALAESGLIARGDQQQVAHLRADRRPVVWDLAVKGRQVRLDDSGDLGAEPWRGDDEVTPPRGDSAVSPRASRGDVGGTHGVTEPSPNPRTEHNTPTELGSKGDPQAREHAQPLLVTAARGPAFVPHPEQPCTGCGTTEARRPIVGHGMCMRCLVAWHAGERLEQPLAPPSLSAGGSL